MRQSLNILLFSILMLLIFNCNLMAVLGDCNGDGAMNISDAVYVIDYFYSNGPEIVSFYECDCDGMPGITLGDALQIIYAAFEGGKLYASDHADFPMASEVEFTFNRYPVKFHAAQVVRIYVNVPDSIAIKNFEIPISYAAELDQAELMFDSIVLNYRGDSKSMYLSKPVYDPEKEIVFNGATSESHRPILDSSNSGLLCILYFTKIGDGTPNDIKVITTDHGLYPLLITGYYSGVNGISKLLPMISSTIPGDANCDCKVNLSDAIWIVTYLFAGGPAPGDCVE